MASIPFPLLSEVHTRRSPDRLGQGGRQRPAPAAWCAAATRCHPVISQPAYSCPSMNSRAEWPHADPRRNLSSNLGGLRPTIRLATRRARLDTRRIAANGGVGSHEILSGGLE